MRAPQGGLAAFFAAPADRTSLAAMAPGTDCKDPTYLASKLVAFAEAVLHELAGLRQEAESADFSARSAARRLTPEAGSQRTNSSSSEAAFASDVEDVYQSHADESARENEQRKRLREQLEASPTLITFALSSRAVPIVVDRRFVWHEYRKRSPFAHTT